MTIQNRIKDRRQQLGLSLQSVAEGCGVTWQSVQKWERTGGPSRRHMPNLAATLKVSLEWLITGQQAKVQTASIDFSKLSGQEAQLVMFFRTMDEPDKLELLNISHKLSQKNLDEFGAVLMKPKQSPPFQEKKKKTT